MSFSTTAAARQKEINERATVVATTTFAVLTFPEVSDICIALLEENETEPVGPQ
jgi:hypothetical protein